MRTQRFERSDWIYNAFETGARVAMTVAILTMMAGLMVMAAQLMVVI